MSSLGISRYQGGISCEVFTPQGSNPTSNCKLFGSRGIQKVYDRTVKGFVYDCHGGPACKLQLPKDEQKAGLHLVQPFLVLQILVSGNQHFAFELSICDSTGTRRKLFFSTSFSEMKMTPLHSQLPLTMVKRDVWLNLAINIPELVTGCFRGLLFRSLEAIVISSVCKLRKIFTMRSRPLGTGEAAEAHFLLLGSGEIIPADLAFSPGVEFITQVLDITTVQDAAVQLESSVQSDAPGGRHRSTAGAALAKGKDAPSAPTLAQRKPAAGRERLPSSSNSHAGDSSDDLGGSPESSATSSGQVEQRGRARRPSAADSQHSLDGKEEPPAKRLSERLAGRGKAPPPARRLSAAAASGREGGAAAPPAAAAAAARKKEPPTPSVDKDKKPGSAAKKPLRDSKSDSSKLDSSSGTTKTAAVARRASVPNGRGAAAGGTRRATTGTLPSSQRRLSLEQEDAHGGTTDEGSNSNGQRQQTYQQSRYADSPPGKAPSSVGGWEQEGVRASLDEDFVRKGGWGDLKDSGAPRQEQVVDDARESWLDSKLRSGAGMGEDQPQASGRSSRYSDDGKLTSNTLRRQNNSLRRSSVDSLQDVVRPKGVRPRNGSGFGGKDDGLQPSSTAVSSIFRNGELSVRSGGDSGQTFGAGSSRRSSAAVESLGRGESGDRLHGDDRDQPLDLFDDEVALTRRTSEARLGHAIRAAVEPLGRDSTAKSGGTPGSSDPQGSWGRFGLVPGRRQDVDRYADSGNAALDVGESTTSSRGWRASNGGPSSGVMDRVGGRRGGGLGGDDSERGHVSGSDEEDLMRDLLPVTLKREGDVGFKKKPPISPNSLPGVAKSNGKGENVVVAPATTRGLVESKAEAFGEGGLPHGGGGSKMSILQKPDSQYNRFDYEGADDVGPGPSDTSAAPSVARGSAAGDQSTAGTAPGRSSDQGGSSPVQGTAKKPPASSRNGPPKGAAAWLDRLSAEAAHGDTHRRSDPSWLASTSSATAPGPFPSLSPTRSRVSSSEGDGLYPQNGGNLDLLYDPILNCYYDPKTNSYYELK